VCIEALSSLSRACKGRAPLTVIPAQAGIHFAFTPPLSRADPRPKWIPAFAGMTEGEGGRRRDDQPASDRLSITNRYFTSLFCIRS